MRIFSLLVIPLFLFITSFFLSQSRGPHWLGSVTDPDYAYLFNALSLIQGYPIAHLDHPGTTVQSIGQIMIITVGYFTPEPDYITDVIKRPEFYMQAIGTIFTLMISSVLALLGMIVYKLTQNLKIALFLQLTPFVSLALIGEPLTKISTEPLILISVTIFLISLTLFYYSKSHIRLSLLLFCLSIGFGTATKLTFGPMIMIPFLAFRSLRQKAALIAGSSFLFFVFTKPIVESYPRLWSWVKALFIHSGRNAEGSATIIDLDTFIPNFSNLIKSEPLFYLVIFFETIILGYLISKRNFSKQFYLLLGIFIVQITQTLLVAKHPGASYLAPPLGITLFSILIMLDVSQKVKSLNKYFTEKRLYSHYLPMLMMIIFLIGLYTIFTFNKSLLKLKNDQLQVYDEVNRKYPGQVVIRYHRSSSPLYALKFGNTFISNNFTHYLNNIYPDTYFWDIWNARFNGWDMEPIQFKQITAKVLEDPKIINKQIIFHGTSFEHHYMEYPNYKPKLKLQDVYSGEENTLEKETIYTFDIPQL